MLRTLRIRHFAIVEDLRVEFGPGFNVLTGETGAGKSILVDALGLAVGARADRAFVRAGKDAAIVEALFELPAGGAALRLAEERGLVDGGAREVLVRREVAADGPNRILVNGSPATQGLLQELGALLLELHGQHEHQRLFDPRRQLELLDLLGGCAAAVAAVERAWEACAQAQRELDELRARADLRRDRQARLEAELREIDAVAPRVGELEAVDGERLRLRNAGSIVQLLDEAVGAIDEGEPGAAALASTAAARARRLATFDPALAEIAARLESAALELQDAGAGLRDYRDRADFDPTRLDALETRRAALERLRLRYGKDEAEVLAHRAATSAELEALGHAEQDAARARRALDDAERAYVAAAGHLGAARRAAARRLCPAVEAELRALALGTAQVEVRFTPATGRTVEIDGGAPVPLGARGAERAELFLAANPGEPPRPLSRSASGGELSRIMLALHGIFAAASGDAESLVFDEVDAGVGGSVADAVGARLAGLAARHQVLCVTHLPQVARWADRHLAVRKSVREGRTRVDVSALGREERVEELARMLGGKVVTDASRRNAADLLRQVHDRAGPRPRAEPG